MGRQDVDLELKIEDPEEARHYIRHFNWHPCDPPKYIVLELDQRIYLDRMTDAEAVTAAKIILHDVDIPSTMREKNLENWEH